MIVQLQHRKDLKKELKNIWTKLNDLKVAMFFLKENEHAIYKAKKFLENSGDDPRLEKIVNAFDSLEDLVDLECFESMEKATEVAQDVIDNEFFNGSLFREFIEEDDEE